MIGQLNLSKILERGKWENSFLYKMRSTTLPNLINVFKKEKENFDFYSSKFYSEIREDYIPAFRKFAKKVDGYYGTESPEGTPEESANI